MTSSSVETCHDCAFVAKHPHRRSKDVAAYLRELADRVDRGEVHHVSVSAHPVKRSS